MCSKINAHRCNGNLQITYTEGLQDIWLELHETWSFIISEDQEHDYLVVIVEPFYVSYGTSKDCSDSSNCSTRHVQGFRKRRECVPYMIDTTQAKSIAFFVIAVLSFDPMTVWKPLSDLLYSPTKTECATDSKCLNSSGQAMDCADSVCFAKTDDLKRFNSDCFPAESGMGSAAVR